MAKTQVVILAGGLGTRLRPITEKIPKPMVEVAGMPFLHWQLADIQRQGYTKILLLTSYLSEIVEAHYGDGQKVGLDIKYSVEPEPLGTGGALRLAAEKLEPRFILYNGDTFLEADLKAMEGYFETNRCAALVSTFNRPHEVGVPANVKVESATLPGPVLDYRKGGGEGFECVDSGIYIIDRTRLSAVWSQMDQQKFQLAELWPPFLIEQSLHSYPIPRKFFDIGTPNRLKEFENHLKGHS